MATPVIMPKQGQSVESCVISTWYKKKGEKVCKGDLLFSYETDKATFDEEAEVEGTILEIFFTEGDEVPVLTNVCVIGSEGEDTTQFNPHASGGDLEVEEEKRVRSESETSGAQGSAQAETAPGGTEERLKISPRARHLATEMGVDYYRASPTGPRGRIIARDIAALQEVKTVSEAEIEQGAADYEEVELTRARRLIAERMHASLASAAQLTLNTSFDASGLIALRKKIKADHERNDVEKITINDMIVYAVARTILKYRELNAHLLGEKMLLFHHAHLGVAVDTERGLLVPTLFDADQKSLSEIARETKRMATGCREGTISPDYLQGASFTVTNLGALGIESFTPVINLPQTGILGVGAITWRIRERSGEYIHYPAMGLSLTFDHRAVDGAPVARFLQELTSNLEEFALLLCI